jgi:hypothetical protein
MVLINHQHKGFESVLGLESLLGGFALLLSFFFEDCEFRSMRLLSIIHLDLHGDEVLLDALDHMLVLALLHHFEFCGFLDFIHFGLGVHDSIRLLVDFLFDVVLLILLMFKLALHFLKVLFFGFDLASDQVILLAEFAHGN